MEYWRGSVFDFVEDLVMRFYSKLEHIPET
jgi:hypothetical protein